MQSVRQACAVHHRVYEADGKRMSWFSRP